jgi:sigma-B regulation protein RsbU (phosphoserine phosphatase)
VGDASGHGISAAMVIAETRAYLRALALTSSNPAEILTLTNQRLAEDLSCDNFVTLLLVRIDASSLSLQCAGAGHHPGYVLSSNGAIKAVLTSEGLPLGIDSAVEIPPGQNVKLESGDLVFLYTDGIVEAAGEAGDELFGIARALDCLRSHQQESLDDIVEALYSAVDTFSAAAEQADDITAFLIKV